MRRVLVIEGDPKEMAIARRVVLRAGLFPDCVATGEEAIASLLKKTYAYILLEASMNAVNLSLIISLANKCGAKARVVVMTKDSSISEERKLRKMGISHYIVRPTSDLELSLLLQHSR